MGEAGRGDRFAFGENWRRFLSGLGEEQIEHAENSLQEMLGTDSLQGKSFLDAGCGSGLSSLVARRLGARVHSFDIDPLSVACCRELKRRFFPDDGDWTIEEGSVLDGAYLEGLGDYEIVYSWGVLHHTGAMYRALEEVARIVPPGGVLFLALYNDQGRVSAMWGKVKSAYNSLPRPLQFLMVLATAGIMEAKYALARLLTLRNPLPFVSWREKKKDRGMSLWHDYVDWVGGYPFETARPEEILAFLRKKGFLLENLVTSGGGYGCNQYVFSRAK